MGTCAAAVEPSVSATSPTATATITPKAKPSGLAIGARPLIQIPVEYLRARPEHHPGFLRRVS